MRKKKRMAPKLRRSCVVRLSQRRSERRGHTHANERGKGRRGAFLESECVEFFRGVFREEEKREKETLTPIQITSAAAAGEPPPSEQEGGAAFQKCWNSWDGWLRLTGNELELAAVQSPRVGDSEHEPVHGMMVQVQEMEGVIK